jgi:hypothetical protein
MRQALVGALLLISPQQQALNQMPLQKEYDFSSNIHARAVAGMIANSRDRSFFAKLKTDEPVPRTVILRFQGGRSPVAISIRNIIFGNLDVNSAVDDWTPVHADTTIIISIPRDVDSIERAQFDNCCVTSVKFKRK